MHQDERQQAAQVTANNKTAKLHSADKRTKRWAKYDSTQKSTPSNTHTIAVDESGRDVLVHARGLNGAVGANLNTKQQIHNENVDIHGAHEQM